MQEVEEKVEEKAELSQWTLNSLARLVYRKAQAWYRVPENRAKYEEWHLKEYGVPCVWQTQADIETAD